MGKYGVFVQLYAINEELKQVQVFAVRQQTPYDYADLDKLLDELE